MREPNKPKLAKFQDRGNNVKNRFIMQYIDQTLYYHPYLINGKEAYLFRNITNEATGELLVDHLWMNKSKTLANLNMRKGDIVVLDAYAELYLTGNEYHYLNVRRPAHKKTYRLLYPSNAKVIGNEEVILPKILSLEDLKIYDDFKSLFDSMVGKMPFDLLLVHLWDNRFRYNLINRVGNVASKDYPPLCVFIDTWDSLSDRDRTALLDCRKYRYSDLIEFLALLKE